METQITGLNVSLSHHVRSYASSKVFSPLRRFTGRIRSVVVRLQDVDPSNLDSPRRVNAVVTMNNGTVLVVDESRSADFYAAVDLLGERVKEVVRRHLDRRKSKRRRGQ